MTKTKAQSVKRGPKSPRRLDHSHTGKLRPSRHTSYASLVFMLLFMIVPLVAASGAMVSAASFPTPPPVTTQYGTYAVVTGPKPGAPSINNLTQGAVFTTASPVQARGDCNSGDLVKIFKNEVLAGAAYCAGGHYEVTIDLFVGNNSLVARAYNANDAVSVDSANISVQLQLPGTNLAGIGQLNNQGAPAGQFYITSQITHQGVPAGDNSVWHLTTVGGQAPYAYSVSWGDGKTDLYSNGTSGNYDIQHVYAKSTASGSHVVIIKATDQAGNKSYLQLAALVASDGTTGGLVGAITGGYSGSAAIRIGWQLLGGAALTIAGFWLGERHELRSLSAHKA